MPTQQICIRAENAGVRVSQLSAGTMGIWQEMGGLTTQQKDNKVRDSLWEIAQSMTINNKLGAGPERWDLLIDCWVNQICDLAPKQWLRKCSLSDKTISDDEELQAALDGFTEVELCLWKNRITKTPTTKWKDGYICMYFIAQIFSFWCSWWCVDTEDDKDPMMGQRWLPIQVHCNDSSDLHVESLSGTITYVYPDITGKRVGENNTQRFP